MGKCLIENNGQPKHFVISLFIMHKNYDDLTNPLQFIHVRQKFNKVKNGISYFAEVYLDINLKTVSKTIEIRCDGQGFSAQGHMETATSFGYDDWKQGAVLGIEYACQKANCINYHITITKIIGLSTDTNPTIVGVTAILAVWQAINFVVAKETIRKLEEYVFTSWNMAIAELPYFDY